jgi:hypothetical protein
VERVRAHLFKPALDENLKRKKSKAAFILKEQKEKNQKYIIINLNHEYRF